MGPADPRIDPESLLHDFADALIALSTDLKILFWSRGAEEMYGFTRDEVLGKSVVERSQSQTCRLVTSLVL